MRNLNEKYIFVVVGETNCLVPKNGHSSDALFLDTKKEWVPIMGQIDFWLLYRRIQVELQKYYTRGVTC